MTELEHHLFNCLEGLQQEFYSSQKEQDKHLNDLEVRQTEQENDLNQLKELFKELEPLLHRLNSTLQHVWNSVPKK
nr:MbeD/MobD family mobilization/exclusion protein [Solidesulfovibrio fructosivorans]